MKEHSQAFKEIIHTIHSKSYCKLLDLVVDLQSL